MPATNATTTIRFDHSQCKHARTGAEGKKARAACRKAHAAEAAKATETKKTVSKPAPRKRAVKKPVPVSVPETVDELDDSDI